MAVDAPVKLVVDPAQIAIEAGLTLKVGNAKIVTSTGHELEAVPPLGVTVTRYDPLTVAEYVALVPPVLTLAHVLPDSTSH